MKLKVQKTRLNNFIKHRVNSIVNEYYKAGPSYFSRASKRPGMGLEPLPSHKDEQDIDNNDGGAKEDLEMATQNKDILDDPRFIALAQSEAKVVGRDWRDIMLDFDEMLQEFLEQGGDEDPGNFFQHLQDKLSKASEPDMGKTPPAQDIERANMTKVLASPGQEAAMTKRAMESHVPGHDLKTPTGKEADPDKKLLLQDEENEDIDEAIAVLIDAEERLLFLKKEFAEQKENYGNVFSKMMSEWDVTEDDDDDNDKIWDPEKMKYVDIEPEEKKDYPPTEREESTGYRDIVRSELKDDDIIQDPDVNAASAQTYPEGTPERKRLRSIRKHASKRPIKRTLDAPEY